MNSDNIDDLLAKGLPLDEKPGSVQVADLKKLLSSDLRPVRALPSDGRTIALLLTFFAVFSILAAWPVHYFGLRSLSAVQMVIYFCAIGACALLNATAVAQETVPGSKRRVSPTLAIALGIVGLVTVIVLLFPNFDASHFVRYGTGCLRVGSVCGLVAGLLLCFVVRKGFFTSPINATITVAFFASLAGVAVLAMHCSLLTVPHILVWHFGVLLLGLAAGAGAGMFLEINSAKKFTANRNFRDSIPE